MFETCRAGRRRLDDSLCSALVSSRASSRARVLHPVETVFAVANNRGLSELRRIMWHVRAFDLMSCAHANLGTTYAIIEQFVPRSPGTSFFGGVSVGRWIHY